MTTTTRRHLTNPSLPNDAVPTSSEDSRTMVERFLSSFFQEQNIRWMLMAGAAIVFGSSLMLVTRAWPAWENFPALKFLTILGYTVTTWGAAEAGRRRLGLHATSTVLQLLTLSLLPVCYLSIHWLSAGRGVQNLEAIGLLIPATAFLWVASAKIFDHLLQGRQSTCLNSYRLLCLAGALPAFLTPLPAFAFFVVAWLVCSAGIVKVSRHAFWLAEEHRWPRVFAFLPVLLLAGQFLVLVVAKTVSVSDGTLITAIRTPWLGFACVLIAATMLASTKAAADVFRQRTGDLVRPYPWHLSAPLFCGLVVTVSGVVLSASGFRPLGPTTYAIIPASALAAILMGLAAKESRSAAFVWISLIFAAVAYQSSPTLAADLVRQLKQGVESAIHERRLPVAFYGITYLPFVMAAAVGSRFARRHGYLFFAQPLQRFATLVSMVLLAAAISSVKALFVVALVNVGAFLAMAWLFADRRYVLISLAAVVLAAGSALPALNGMQVTNLSPGLIPTILTALATVLTATRLPDRWLNRIPLPERARLRHAATVPISKAGRPSFLLQHRDGSDRGLAQWTGVVLAITMAGYWAVSSAAHLLNRPLTAELIQAGLLLTALLQYHFRRPHYLTGAATVVFSAFAAARFGLGHGMAPESLVQWVSGSAVLLSAAAYAVCRWVLHTNCDRPLEALRERLGGKTGRRGPVAVESSTSWKHSAVGLLVPLCDISGGLAIVLAVVYHAPILLMSNATAVGGASASALPLTTHGTILWLAIVGFVLPARSAAMAFGAVLPLWVAAATAAVVGPLSLPWMITIWAAANAAERLFCRALRSRAENHPALFDANRMAGWWLQAILLMSCVGFALPLRLAAAISVICFLLTDRQPKTASQLSFLAVIGNIQALLLLAAVGGASGLVIPLPGLEALPWLLCGTAFSYLLFDRPTQRFDAVVNQTWAALLRAFSIVLAATVLTAGSYSAELQRLVIAGLAVASVAEVWQAVRKQQEFFVWAACLWLLGTTAFLWTQGILVLGSGISQFVLLIAGVVALSVGHFSKRRTALRILRRPMSVIGQTLPAVVTGLAVVRELAQLAVPFRSANALALMCAAAIYFQQAMVTRKRRFAVAAGVVLNVALMLLSKSLGLQSLEFVLVPIGLTILAFVQVLKKDLPVQVHDPLRYLGALIILVAPSLELLGASWRPSVTLLVMSVLVILLSIGLRLKAPLYTGSAFLAADLVAMVLRSHDVYPFLPWLCGIAVGAALIALAAVCENHREKVLRKIRLLSAELATWN